MLTLHQMSNKQYCLRGFVSFYSRICSTTAVMDSGGIIFSGNERWGAPDVAQVCEISSDGSHFTSDLSPRGP